MENFSKSNNLINGFIKSVNNFPERPALEVDDQIFTYQKLAQIANNIATTICEKESEIRQLAAIFAQRSITAYAGVLAILISGKGYVPLNPKFPLERTYKMLSESKCNVVIVGKECFQKLENLLPKLDQPFTIILPDTSEVGDLQKRFPKHKFVLSQDICTEQDITQSPLTKPEDTAYLLFTSGSTGIPKGVPVSHKNVVSYIKYISERYNVKEHDRFSQMFELTFDLSVHDLFVCWEKGACLFSVPEKCIIAPAKFIKDKQLTMWFSVPSVSMFMSKMRMLKPNSFPTLRYSLFCGEAFSNILAEKWQEAAPNSIVENLYGPTEATIAIAYYIWNNKKSPAECLNEIVPIGWIFEGQKSCIINQEKKLVSKGEKGELCLSGSQVTKDYLNNPEKTREQYIKIPSLGDNIWYRTGDLVQQNDEGCLFYLGRIDNQIQILGHRVELQEIDSALRKISGSEMAISVAWPIKKGIVEGIVAFICGGKIKDKDYITKNCKSLLPGYMVPRAVYFIENPPLNVNGKIDRSKLYNMLNNDGVA